MDKSEAQAGRIEYSEMGMIVGYTMNVTKWIATLLLLIACAPASANESRIIPDFARKSLIPFDADAVRSLAKLLDPTAEVGQKVSNLSYKVEIRWGESKVVLDRLTLDVDFADIVGPNSAEQVGQLAHILGGDFRQVEYNRGQVIFFNSGRKSLLVSQPDRGFERHIESHLPWQLVWDPNKLELVPRPEYLKNSISVNEAVQMGRYYLSKGKSKLTFPLLTWDSEPVWYTVEEDPWLDRKYKVLVRFEIGDLEVDAFTGQVDYFEGSQKSFAKGSYQAEYAADHEIEYKKPERFTRVETELNRMTNFQGHANVVFNGRPMSLLGERGGLHYPPVMSNSSCLVAGDYFPSFLIDTKWEGDKIIMEGRLKGKGKRAIVSVGQRSALVGDTAVELSEAPRLIQGRVLLPYELLKLCNGIPVRWDVESKTLWVDTRYLRRSCEPVP